VVADKKHITILTPVFNDWNALQRLLVDIDELLSNCDFNISVLVVDDGSTESYDVSTLVESGHGFRQVELLTLAANLGHQRAIATGLAELAKREPVDAILVMDCDGEDSVSDIPALVHAASLKPDAIVVAKRSHRSEGILFRLFYSLYKTFFRLFTGYNVDFGNFCVIPYHTLSRITHMPELWNHLAGSVIRSKVAVIKISTSRGERYSGVPKMNFLSLLTHGFSAISVFTDLLFIRLLIFSGVTSFFALAGGIAIVLIKITTDYAIPGWASTLASLALVVLIQSITLLMIGVFMMLSNRSAHPFIPADQASSFVQSLQVISR
jgi:glycosyltransferase involved in cell wall biosynthesis